VPAETRAPKENAERSPVGMRHVLLFLGGWLAVIGVIVGAIAIVGYLLEDTVSMGRLNLDRPHAEMALPLRAGDRLELRFDAKAGVEMSEGQFADQLQESKVRAVLVDAEGP
jgi:hypothetical protein